MVFPSAPHLNRFSVSMHAGCNLSGSFVLEFGHRYLEANFDRLWTRTLDMVE